ncbi:hypothetical protein [Synechocystis sp. PCC 7509]|uniref:hypothetical protein n=1 Tax=Synechocystis sp. PCC 7509 TaxID=927677 RepID=UPI0002ACF7B6|nr:hypothetical protein [Synechocystis sp. PCC 7509]
MPKITLEVSEELAEQLATMGDKLPELLRQSIQNPVVPASIYRYILNFLTSSPTPAQIAAFKPTTEMSDRLQILLNRSQLGKLTTSELAELDEYEHIEHLIIMLKSGNLPHLTSNP